MWCGGGGGGGGGGRGGRGGGGGGGGGDTHTAPDAEIEATRAIYPRGACNARIRYELTRDKIVYSVSVIGSFIWHKKVKS